MEKKRSRKPYTRRAKKACLEVQPSWIHNQGVVLALWKTLVDADKIKDWLSLTSTCRELRSYAHTLNTGVCVVMNLYYGRKKYVFPVGVNRLIVYVCERYLTPMKIPETVTDLSVTQVWHRSISKMPKPVVWPNAYVPLHEGIRILELDVEFTHPVIEWRLPSTLEELKLMRDFNQPVVGWNLPRGLKRLHMGYYFNQPVLGLDIPRGLEELNLGHHFNQPVVGWDLPESLIWIQFGDSFNQEVEGLVLSRYMKKLVLVGDFNKPVSRLNLPVSLITLEFGYDFNQPLGEMKLPPKLETLIFWGCFNQAIEHLEIPSTLKYVRFGNAFKQTIAKLNFRSDMVMWFGYTCYNFILGRTYTDYQMFWAIDSSTQITPETVSDPMVLNSTAFKKYWKRVEHNFL